MSLWELSAGIAAWNKAQGNESELAPLTAEEYDKDIVNMGWLTGPEPESSVH